MIILSLVDFFFKGSIVLNLKKVHLMILSYNEWNCITASCKSKEIERVKHTCTHCAVCWRKPKDEDNVKVFPLTAFTLLLK